MKDRQGNSFCERLENFCNVSKTSIVNAQEAFSRVILTSPNLLTEDTLNVTVHDLWDAQLKSFEAAFTLPLQVMETWSRLNLPKLVSTMGAMSHRLKVISSRTGDNELRKALVAQCNSACWFGYNGTHWEGSGFLGDGQCDESCNNAGCLWDGGDCASTTIGVGGGNGEENHGMGGFNRGFPQYNDHYTFSAAYNLVRKDQDQFFGTTKSHLSWLSQVYDDGDQTNNSTGLLRGCGSDASHGERIHRVEALNLKREILSFVAITNEQLLRESLANSLGSNPIRWEGEMEDWDDATWTANDFPVLPDIDVSSVGLTDATIACDEFFEWLDDSSVGAKPPISQSAWDNFAVSATEFVHQFDIAVVKKRHSSSTNGGGDEKGAAERAIMAFLDEYLKSIGSWYVTGVGFLHASNYKTVQELIRNHFVEDTEVKLWYLQYFTKCGVYTCSYTYRASEDLQQTVVSLLGLVGGVTTVMKILAQVLYFFLQRTSTSGKTEIPKERNNSRLSDNKQAERNKKAAAACDDDDAEMVTVEMDFVDTNMTAV
uniref:LNR domain-containing protein n=1 Tax=Pyramimonas obovata TaxID=1411642 RepID=A0A7S0R3I7_9CHLO